MNGLGLDNFIGERISEEQREMMMIVDKFQEIFGYYISRNLVDVNDQQLHKLLKKSIEKRKDYLKRYVIREVEIEEWIDELIRYIAEKELFPESKEINDFIQNFAQSKELYHLNGDGIYGIIHHLYSLMAECLAENDGGSASDLFENWAKIKEFTEKPIEDLVADTRSDLWEPPQLIELYTLYGEVYKIAEKIARQSEAVTEEESQKAKDAPGVVEELKDEMDLQRAEYCRIEDVEFIWELVSKETLVCCKYIETHNEEDMPERLREKLNGK